MWWTKECVFLEDHVENENDVRKGHLFSHIYVCLESCTYLVQFRLSQMIKNWDQVIKVKK